MKSNSRNLLKEVPGNLNKSSRMNACYILRQLHSSDCLKSLNQLQCFLVFVSPKRTVDWELASSIPRYSQLLAIGKDLRFHYRLNHKIHGTSIHRLLHFVLIQKESFHYVHSRQMLQKGKIPNGVRAQTYCFHLYERFLLKGSGC